MDESEKLARTYLENFGFIDIQYEPNGNVPPDFVCDNHVAVEVRRLNKNYNLSANPKGSEDAYFSLRYGMEKLLASFGPPVHGDSWFICCRFSRPVPKWKVLAPIIRKELEFFMLMAEPFVFDKRLTEYFELTLIRSSEPSAELFILGSITDLQSGGFVVSDVIENLKFCIHQKRERLENVWDDYPEWWLIFPDHIGYGLDKLNRQRFLEHFKKIDDFSKIILLNPLNPNDAFEF